MVTYCPLVPAWATTIHKFQGFGAGFDENDQFKHLIVDPEDLTTELQNPGILYILPWAVLKQLEQCPQMNSTQKTVPYSGRVQESAQLEC